MLECCSSGKTEEIQSLSIPFVAQPLAPRCKYVLKTAGEEQVAGLTSKVWSEPASGSTPTRAECSWREHARLDIQQQASRHRLEPQVRREVSEKVQNGRRGKNFMSTHTLYWQLRGKKDPVNREKPLGNWAQTTWPWCPSYNKYTAACPQL